MPQASKPQRALQEYLLPYGHNCFGCGSKNPIGMRIRSYWDASSGEGVCDWTPQPHHCGGPDFVNGGVIATLIDCHTVCTCMAWMYEQEGRPMDSDPQIHAVTASLKVDYLRPTPLALPLQLRARVITGDDRRVTVACSVISDGKETARGEGVFARVTATTAEERKRLKKQNANA